MPSILVVDDEEGLLASLTTAFEVQGYRAMGAETAAAALALLQREAFEVLLTDLVMPGMDGLTLLERVRPRFPDTAVILMTGGATVETAVRALKGGAADYVLKPFTLSEIFHVVDRALEQQRLRQENLQLSELNRRLRELDQVKSDLLSAVTHEFRTPLTVIQGWVDFLLSGQTDNLSRGQRESLVGVRRGVVRLGRLIANLLALVESHAGQLGAADGPVNLQELLRSTVERLVAEAAERGVRVRVEEGAAPPAVGDGERLRLLCLNLVENAIKFSAPGGEVRAAVRGTAGGAVEMRVGNSTGEIPAEAVPRLLQPFTQGDMGLTRAAGGLGLGLAVVRAIVHAHGGTLQIETGAGKGTTVCVTLPGGAGTPR